MASVIGICNSALIKIGDERIASILEANKRARLCNEQYPKMRDAVMRAHFWNFAMTRVTLAPLVTPPAFGYTQAFQLPADYARFKSFDVDDIEFKIEGQTIVCDETTLNMLYVRKETDTTLFDDLFADCVAWRLAADISYALSQSQAVQAAMFTGYKEALREARGVDSQEGTPDSTESNTFFNSRL